LIGNPNLIGVSPMTFKGGVEIVKELSALTFRTTSKEAELDVKLLHIDNIITNKHKKDKPIFFKLIIFLWSLLSSF